jgi:hypothetical protein
MLQAFDEAPSGGLRRQPGKKISPSFVVGLLALKHVISHPEQRMGDRQHRALLAAPRGQPPVWRTQVGTLHTRGGVSRLHQASPSEAIAGASLARRPFARTGMGAGGPTGPRGPMVSPGNTGHLGADLGHAHVGRVAGHPRNRLQPAHRRFKRSAALLARRLEAGASLVETIKLA